MASETKLRLVGFLEGEEPEAFKVHERERSSSTCRHKAMTVDPVLRIVRCSRCGETLDPIQCLLEIAYDDRAIDSRVELIKQFQAEERNKRDEQRRRKFKPLVELLGERWREFVDRGGWRHGGIWITAVRHAPTGHEFGFSGSTFYSSSGETMTGESLITAVAPPVTEAEQK